MNCIVTLSGHTLASSILSVGKDKRKKTTTKSKTEKSKGDRSYSKRVRVEFTVSFVSYFKTRGIIRVKACCGGV